MLLILNADVVTAMQKLSCVIKRSINGVRSIAKSSAFEQPSVIARMRATTNLAAAR
jgi:hypothetical protein